MASYTVNQLLYQDAESEGESWARYLASNVKDLESIARGAARLAGGLPLIPSARAARRFQRHRR